MMWCRGCGVGMVVRRWLPGMFFWEECTTCGRRTPTLRFGLSNSTNSLWPAPDEEGKR